MIPHYPNKVNIMSIITDASKGLKTIYQTCQRIGIPIDPHIDAAYKVLNDNNKSLYPTFCEAFCAFEKALQNIQKEVSQHHSYKTQRPFTIHTLGSDCDKAYENLQKAFTWLLEQASDEVEVFAMLAISDRSKLCTHT